MIRRLLVCSLVCLLSGVLISCERGVKASREEEPRTYQPRPAPAEKRPVDKDAKGELIGVDMKNNTIMVRVENGMEQTFKFDDHTVVQGVPDRSTTSNNATSKGVRSLMGKEGSEVIVTWTDQAGARKATAVTVDQLVTKKGNSRKRSWSKH